MLHFYLIDFRSVGLSYQDDFWDLPAQSKCILTPIHNQTMLNSSTTTALENRTVAPAQSRARNITGVLGAKLWTRGTIVAFVLVLALIVFEMSILTRLFRIYFAKLEQCGYSISAARICSGKQSIRRKICL